MTKEFAIQLYKTMIRIRYAEEQIVTGVMNGFIKTPCHLCVGHEAVATGVCAALSREDYIFGNHRSHGHYLAKGGNLKELFAEIYGKKNGCSRGRGGSMHIIAPECGMLGSVPIVAGTASLAVGAALAVKIRGEHRVIVSFFGDGAVGEGVLHESINFAALHKLPIIFACENNLYSTHLPICECRPRNNIWQIGKPYGIFSARIDGNKVIDVYSAAKKAVRRCQRGQGPVFLEFLTYRLRGHVGPDDNIQGEHADIRPKEEVEKWKKKDPILQFEHFVLKKGSIDQKTLSQIQQEIKKEMRSAYQFARRSPYPSQHELSYYVYKK